MADSLFELLSPYFNTDSTLQVAPDIHDQVTAKYLNRLSTLPLDSLTNAEPQSLAQSSHTNDISISSLSARSHVSLTSSSNHFTNLGSSLPPLVQVSESLRSSVPRFDNGVVKFSKKYSRSTENEILDRRKQALLMARNVDRLSDILDLPILLASTITSSTAQGASNPNSYASALDLHSHIKRLHLLHRGSKIIGSVCSQTEAAMQEMTSNLINSLRAQNVKLAAGMRTIGWLRRIAPEFDGSGGNREGCLGALFLVCRLATLVSMLSALEPLQDLAEQETALRERDTKSGTLKSSKDAWAHGQQTERYLKRYIEIFREQSFGIVSMYKSIFPASSDMTPADDIAYKMKSMGLKSTLPASQQVKSERMDHLSSVPSALMTFPLHLVTLLSATLQKYLPNVRDGPSRESLLTQVLYCAGSLGRLGGDFSMLLAVMSSIDGHGDDNDEELEWITTMKKHRVLASKLEKMASGNG